MRCSRSRAAERIFAVDARLEGQRYLGSVRGTRHRLRVVSPDQREVPDRRDEQGYQAGGGGGGELLQRFAPEAMTKRHRLEGNLGAAEVELTINDLAGIGRAAAAIQVEGERYPPQIQAGAGR
jgi:hypothetical protein